MDFGFLFWAVLVGLIVASLQDLKRREVDNWLNYLILLFGVSYIVFSSFIEESFINILYLGVLLLLFYGLMYLFYYGRVFAGGDAKLLFALCPLFLGAGLRESLVNSGIFVLLLLVAGSVYGFIYSLVLYLRNISKANLFFASKIRENKLVLGIFEGVVLIFGMVFILSSFFEYLIFVWLFLLVLPFFYFFALSLESVVMVKRVSGRDLREGDWLLKAVMIGRKKIRPCWDGLSKKDLKLLAKKKMVLIKEGIPFVPSFLMAFILYSFFSNFILEEFFNIFGSILH